MHLVEAIKRDDIQFIKGALRQKPDIIHMQNIEGGTLLHLAAAHKSYDCIQLLVASGANIHQADMFGESLADMATLDSRIADILAQRGETL